MYNAEYNCSYMDSDVFLETDEVNDCEKEFIRNCIYRQDVLNIFDLDEFNESVVNKNINNVYHDVEKEPELHKCITKVADVYGDPLIGFMVLFSYDYLYLTHPCICDFMKTGKITEDNITNLRNILIALEQ